MREDGLDLLNRRRVEDSKSYLEVFPHWQKNAPESGVVEHACVHIGREIDMARHPKTCALRQSADEPKKLGAVAFLHFDTLFVRALGEREKRLYQIYAKHSGQRQHAGDDDNDTNYAAPFCVRQDFLAKELGHIKRSDKNGDAQADQRKVVDKKQDDSKRLVYDCAFYAAMLTRHNRTSAAEESSLH